MLCGRSNAVRAIECCAGDRMPCGRSNAVRVIECRAGDRLMKTGSKTGARTQRKQLPISTLLSLSLGQWHKLWLLLKCIIPKTHSQ
jgi:hypothetical protein